MNIKSIFLNAEWICPSAYKDLKPINVFHKECEPLEIPLPNELKNLHIYFRKSFDYKKTQGRVIIRITADDYYKLYINGSFVGQGPAQGYYFNYYWNEFDITDILVNGENHIYAEVYYQGLINRAYNSGDQRLGMIASVICGEEELVKTDRSWECAVSDEYITEKIIGYDTVYAENFDSRKKPSVWENSVIKEVDYDFDRTPAKPLQVYLKAPIYSEALENGGVFYDFGEEITAGLVIEAIGRSGDSVRILCGEETEASAVKVRYNMRCNCLCEEVWILDDGENRLCQYDYKGFRYAALIPTDGVKIISVKAAVRHYPFDDNYCRLETDNQILANIWEMCKRTVKYGSQEVFVDCPTREKGQYAGDMTVTSASHLVLTGDTSLLKKAIDNQAQSSFICKGLMAVTPGSLMQEIADYSLQFPILALRHYDYTGDKEYLKENLVTCEELLSYFKKYARPDGLICDVTDKWNLVDWPVNLRDGYDFPLDRPMKKGVGCHNVLNAFYVGCVMQTEQIKDILGISHEGYADKLVAAFNREFLNEKTGLYTDCAATEHTSLHSCAIPLFYGITPKEHMQAQADFIMKKGLNCGVYTAYFVLKALCRAGRYEDALSLIVSKDENSWYNMLKEGATTCFEAWGKDKKWNTSLCHPWATAPISVLAEDILPNMPDVGKIVFSE